MPNVLLFREPSAGPDRYELLFAQDNDYKARCLPVLETVHCNISHLSNLLWRDYTEFSGVIVTSKRSCDALQKALQSLSNESEGLVQALAFWSSVPFYVVGDSTASAVRNVQSQFKSYGFTGVVIKGEASGTGEHLGRYIIKEHPNGAKPLLYLIGDKNRDTVPTLLKQGDISFQSLQVYKTQPRCDFQDTLNYAVDTLPAGAPWWVVYFAPSSAKFVAPFVRDHPRLEGARIAAIGPVTSTFLQNDLHLTVNVVSPNPKPEDLVEAIVAYDSREPI